MADKGIIFSAPMVRALLAGRKTQTRRLLSPQPVWEVAESRAHSIIADGWAWKGLAAFREENFGEAALSHVPYAVGDRLYVREAWAANEGTSGGVVYRVDHGRASSFAVYDLKAGGDPTTLVSKWRPSIHMPRSASRLWLGVTDVRVQRLQAITLGDICAEGLGASVYDFRPIDRGFEEWRQLWDSLHTADGATWEANPWIVAVSFDVHHGNIDAPTSNDEAARAEGGGA